MTSPRELLHLRRALHARLPFLGSWRRRSALSRLEEIKEDPAVVPFLVEAAGDPRPQTARRARDAVRTLRSPQAVDALCEIALNAPRGLAAELCLETRRRPSDHDRACLFLFVTRQLDAYFSEDDGFQSLRLEYERADRKLREEILRVVRSGDHRCLGFFGARKRLAECTEAEVFVALEFFRKHSDWPRLFQAFLELPLKYGFLILRELDRAKWRPTDLEERQLLERCLNASRSHLTAPAAANRIPGELFQSLLDRGRAPPYSTWNEERLIQHLAHSSSGRSSPLEGVSIASAIAALRTPSIEAMRAVEESPHWLVRLAGRLLGLAVDPTGLGADDLVHWLRTVSPPAPLLEFWPERGSPAHLDVLSGTSDAPDTDTFDEGPLASAREVLRLLLAHRITAGEFEQLRLDSSEFGGTFEPAFETLEKFAEAWELDHGDSAR